MPPIVEIAGLAKTYPGAAAPAVAGLSFSVDEGEIFGILGPNGAGKTTALSMLSGLIEPSRGTARVAGHDLRRDPYGVKRLIGLVPQDLALYPTLSSRDNLAYFGSLYGLAGQRLRRRVAEALALVRLEDRAGDAVATLSGGMKRRINIAAGLIHQPRVLLLDEPTVGVDPQSRNFIFEGIAALKQAGLAVLYTTHYMEEAERLCDRLAIMDHGQVIVLGTPTALIAAHGALVVIGCTGSGAESATRDLAALEGVASAVAAEGRITLRVTAPARILGRAVEIIGRAGLEIRSVEIRERSLEAVFLELTGRRLRD